MRLLKTAVGDSRYHEAGHDALPSTPFKFKIITFSSNAKDKMLLNVMSANGFV
jgi:hypothetical protein